MDTYLFDRQTYQRFYNCNAYQTDKIPLAERRQVILGSIHVALFLTLQPLYLICLLAIYKRIDSSCYKIMFFMGIVDICCLPITGLIHGYLGIIGSVFCTAPDFIYITGCVAMALWGCESTAAILLALNRCLEIALPKAGERIFRGHRTWLWILAAATYGVSFGFFGKPVLFTSIIMAWTIDPHVGYLADESNWINVTLHNIRLCFVTFLQVFILSIVHINASGVYCIMLFIPFSQILVTTAMFGWFFAHGIPPVIYLTLNMSIRRDCRRILKGIMNRNKKCVTVSTIPSTLSMRSQRLDN
ncbi:serpentine type 7TM GPCR chemoreceptor srt domain-containing protein [Ditylenchus destructor]|uniref:Serpentine type 7TM GPCR chemoreceptor srt domain-containing protein n=1 Tax=Ditylenchus destructor TaxID=166010 RepID=A0AAD4R2I3_9BILA|nr:serpentine type 7TM GPCR chemoreceptor srt domain-containing protein [Ditylenchus destructor]